MAGTTGTSRHKMIRLFPSKTSRGILEQYELIVKDQKRLERLGCFLTNVKRKRLQILDRRRTVILKAAQQTRPHRVQPFRDYLEGGDSCFSLASYTLKRVKQLSRLQDTLNFQFTHPDFEPPLPLRGPSSGGM